MSTRRLPGPAALLLGALCLIALCLIAPVAEADMAQIRMVELSRTAPGTFRIEVTLAHADSGWEHYADKWDILGPDDAVLATRVLHHPHVNEQPFTRALSGVKLAPRVRFVRIRPHDKTHGYGKISSYIEVPGRQVPPKCRPDNAPGWLPEK